MSGPLLNEGDGTWLLNEGPSEGLDSEYSSAIYTSRNEVRAILGTVGINSQIDDDQSEVVDSTEESYLTDAMEEATDIVNAFLLTYYRPVYLTQSRIIRRWTSYITCYLITMRRGNAKHFEARYNEIIGAMTLISTNGPGNGGAPIIPFLPTRDDHRPAHSNLVIDDRYRQPLRIRDSSSTGTREPTRDVGLEPWYQ